MGVSSPHSQGNLISLTRNATDPNRAIPTLAIDFGQKGGLVYNKDGKLHLVDMPSSKEKIRYTISSCGARRSFGEHVHSMPGQGVVSVGTFMRDTGVIEGILCAYDIQFSEISPISWINWYGVGKSGDFKTKDQWKKHLLAHAREIFPDLQITQNCADALLIWNYATQQLARPSFK